MKKKMVCALLSAAMVSTMLVGCGGGSEETATETTETTETTDTAETTDEAGEETTDEATEETTASAEGGKVYYLN